MGKDLRYLVQLLEHSWDCCKVRKRVVRKCWVRVGSINVVAADNARSFGPIHWVIGAVLASMAPSTSFSVTFSCIFFVAINIQVVKLSRTTLANRPEVVVNKGILPNPAPTPTPSLQEHQTQDVLWPTLAPHLHLHLHFFRILIPGCSVDCSMYQQ